MVFLGPAPMLAIGQLVIFSNPASTRSRLVGNAAAYAVFLTIGSLVARSARDHLGVSESSAWFALVVIGLFLITWALQTWSGWVEFVSASRSSAAQDGP
jgi:hypothetical protein